ncbi:MAG: DNA-binding protein [Streptomyces sp.]|jgi:hypothetical protein|uniref:DNA-binding protein n=1 Tax=Streptomyces sp. TaxID=1931 RepID=UPI0025D17011|nr:DNA-binding protein [Streptomyces sp.]MBW8796362.1 DNA-binding protein [Streptomyces sp.]
MTRDQQAEESTHLTVADLAKRWNTTTRAIYIARHRGKAPKAFKRGESRSAPVLFPLTEVLAFEARLMAEDRPSHRGTTIEHRSAEPLHGR